MLRRFLGEPYTTINEQVEEYNSYFSLPLFWTQNFKMVASPLTQFLRLVKKASNHKTDRLIHAWNYIKTLESSQKDAQKNLALNSELKICVTSWSVLALFILQVLFVEFSKVSLLIFSEVLLTLLFHGSHNSCSVSVVGLGQFDLLLCVSLWFVFDCVSWVLLISFKRLLSSLLLQNWLNLIPFSYKSLVDHKFVSL